ncbi:MAG: N-acetyltransferase family protein [Thermodesulfobacteriota bacterium]
MKDYPKEVILRDGSGVTLRPIAPHDGPMLERMLHRLSEEDRWFLGLDEDVSAFVQMWIRFAGTDRVFSIAAVLEGRMIAVAALVRERPGAEGHVGHVRISVTPEYRERRLGTWMLMDLINAAMSMGLERVVMRLVEGRDDTIIRGVEKLRFNREATLEDFVKDMEGNFHNLDLMVKRLPREWVPEDA